MKTCVALGIALLIPLLVSCGNEEPPVSMFVRDLEHVHLALTELLDQSPYQAKYTGILGNPTNQGGIQKAKHEHGWQIFDRNTHNLRSIIGAYEVSSEKSDATEKVHTFTYNSVTIVLLSNSSTIAESEQGEILFDDLAEILEATL